MLVVAMVFASVWAVVQLAVLASGVRSVRVGLLLLAVGTGVYACGPAALAIQYAYTRAFAALSGRPLPVVVMDAAYTVDPFVEEIVKVLPVLVLAWWARGRLQRGLADHLLLGAALGAGFGLLEALMRFGFRAGSAISGPTGWVLPLSLSPPVIPNLGTSLFSWLPAPVGSDSFLAVSTGPGVNVHVVWSAVAGLGVGFLVRERGRLRLLGPLLVLAVGWDHAAYNYDLMHRGDHPIGDVLAAPFVLAQPLFWLWPVVALVVAVIFDARSLAAARERLPSLVLRREAPGLPGARALGQYALMGRPWALVVVPRFVLLRRSAWYADSEVLVAEVASARDQLDAADSAAAWSGVGRISIDRANLLRRFWPLLVWAVLLLPAFLYYVVGSTPGLASVQGGLQHRVPFLLLLVVPAVAGLAWLVRQLVTGVRALRVVSASPSADPAARLLLRLQTGLGAGALGVLTLSAAVRGASPTAPVVPAAHVLEALDSLLLAAGVALLIGSFMFFPPVGLVALATATGTVYVPVATLTSGFLITSVLGIAGIVLSQAASSGNAGPSGPSGSSGGGSGVPDMPPKAPARAPNVRHWRLRKIVDDAYRGAENPNRVGDGTTMDAVRNELRTGRPTAGKFHSVKARDLVTRLSRWLRANEKTATRPDVASARRLLEDLKNSLGGN